MKCIRLRLALGVALALAASRRRCATLNVFATVPEWGALVEELGGDKVKVYVATNALQDPHHVEAKPSLIARARNADLVVATGAELEIGWLPLVLQQAGNPEGPAREARLLRGRAAYVNAARQAGAPRSRGGRRARRRRSAHPDRSAQHRAGRGAARRAPGGARSGECRVLPGARQGLRRALERRDRQLGTARRRR